MANPTYFQERKDFLARMIKEIPKNAWRREMGHTKKIFFVDHAKKSPKELRYPIEFLNVVRPPFEMNSVAYFIGGDGLKYLEVELNKFKFKPESVGSEEFSEKVGEDLSVSKTLSIRDLLNE